MRGFFLCTCSDASMALQLIFFFCSLLDCRKECARPFPSLGLDQTSLSFEESCDLVYWYFRWMEFVWRYSEWTSFPSIVTWEFSESGSLYASLACLLLSLLCLRGSMVSLALPSEKWKDRKWVCTSEWEEGEYCLYSFFFFGLFHSLHSPTTCLRLPLGSGLEARDHIIISISIRSS